MGDDAMAHYQITFRDMLPSEELRAVAEEKFVRVARWYGRAASCGILIATSFGRQGETTYAARVMLHSGGEDEHVAANAEHPDPAQAVHAAFDRACLELDAPLT
jgi:ribosome-associated translation inhibitor RaiA